MVGDLGIYYKRIAVVLGFITLAAAPWQPSRPTVVV